MLASSCKAQYQLWFVNPSRMRKRPLMAVFSTFRAMVLQLWQLPYLRNSPYTISIISLVELAKGLVMG